MKKAIILIPVIFVAVLVVSIGLRVVLSPDFSGFTKPPLKEPVIRYLSGENGESAGNVNTAYNWEDHPVVVIGDSLTQGARKNIEKAIGDATIDGKVNRTMSTGLSMLKEWDSSGIIADDSIIVVCLAHNITNTTVSDAEQIVEMIRPGQSLIMMTGHGNSNMASINEYIRSLPNNYSYITLADWDLTIAQSPRLLSDDGIHIGGRQGNELYADLILRALEVTKPMP
jgi:hypothetical protein